MSAGRFTGSTYETDAGALYPCRVQPETLAMTIDGTPNTPATGPVPAGVPSANMRGSKRQNGITARTVNLRLPDGGTAPDGYSGDNVSVPVLTAVLFAAISRSSTVVYLGTTWEVAGTSNESIK